MAAEESIPLAERPRWREFNSILQIIQRNHPVTMKFNRQCCILIATQILIVEPFSVSFFRMSGKRFPCIPVWMPILSSTRPRVRSHLMMPCTCYMKSGSLRNEITNPLYSSLTRQISTTPGSSQKRVGWSYAITNERYFTFDP